MAESTKNKATISPQNQLYWFVDKLISIYKNPITVILQEYDELTCFPVGLLKKEETGLFPLGRYDGSTEFDNENQEYASYCTEMLEKIKGDISKLEDYGLHFNKEDFTWYEDNNNYEGNGYAFYLDCDYKPIFEAYLRFMNGEKIETNVKEDIKKKGTNKFPYKLLSGTKWENFIIEFLDYKNIKIEVKGRIHTTNYKEMGLVGKGKNPEPSEAWAFLEVLAKLNGEISVEDPEARERYKHQKKFLAENLQDYFTLDYDPFYPYKEAIKDRKQKNSYKIKILLVPPPIDEEKSDRYIAQVDLTSPLIQEEKEIDSKNEEENNDPLGIKEYLDDQCTEIYDDELDKN